ncbi:MAG: hypothetical protein NTU57_01085 [Candidatus Aenigmarchaeota archaeon]|nr:hypothetical protein [Candidatus Aenigmarchaeota archaeon]
MKTKGQMHMMEYVLLSFFVLLIIVVVTFFLTGWQISSTRSERREVEYQKAEFLLRTIANSPYINRNTYKEGSMLEDSKLTSITCEEFQTLYGTGWYAEIEIPGFNDACLPDVYPLCGSWSYCKDESKEAMIFDIPVNIYRKMTGAVDAGFLRVGVYINAN